MNELTTTTAANLPVPCPPNMDRAISYFSNKLFPVGLGHQLYADEAPTPEQRQGLERRSSRLVSWLAPFGSADHQSVRDEVGAVLATLKGESNSATDAEVFLRIYVEDLADLPFFAIQAACRDFRKGRAGDKRWRPTQAEIREVALKHMRPVATERRKLQAILEAKVIEKNPDKGHRAEVAAAARATMEAGAKAVRGFNGEPVA